MAGKDHDLLQKKKAPTGVRGVAGPDGKAPLPEAGVKLQQGTTVDMQTNVGNSGLKDLLAGQEAKSAAKDPSRMGPDELRAQAKADAQALAKKGDPKAKEKAAAKGKGAELDEKQKAVLESEAARKKKEVETARKQKETAEAASARKKAAEKPAGRPGAKGEKEAEAEKGGKPAARKGAKAPAAAEKKGAPGKDAKKGETAAAKGADPAAQARKTAAERKVVAKEADSQHATAKLEAGRTLVGKGKGELGERGKATRGKLADTAKRAAEGKEKAAEAEKKVVEAEGKKPAAKGQIVAGGKDLAGKAGEGASKEKPGKAAAGKGAPAAGESAKGGNEDKAVPAEEARKASRTRQGEKLAAESETAEKELANVKGRKAEVEQKAESEADSSRKALLSREAESAAMAEKAAEEQVKQREEAADALQAAKDKDITIEQITRSADLPVHDGEEVTLVGIYVPRPAEAGGAQLGHVSVMIGEQEVRLGLDVRSTSEILRLSGERVAVTGKLDMKRQPNRPGDAGTREKPILTGIRNPSRR